MSPKDDLFSFGHHEDFADSTQRNLPVLTLVPDAVAEQGPRGVNPYDRGPSQQSATKTQRTDLRKLSEWIKLQKQVEAQKHAPAEEAGTLPTSSRIPPKP